MNRRQALGKSGADAYDHDMEHDREIFSEPDAEAEAASIARARADMAAGRYYDHATVSRWLQTWGTPDRKPFREWLKSSG